MTFRTTLIGGLVAAIGMTGQAKADTLTLSHYLPPVLGLHKDFLEPFARQLEEESGGEITVEMQIGGSSLGNITKQWDQAVDGLSDMSFGLHGIPRGRFPCTQVIELPFLTDSVEEANAILWGLYPEYLAEEHSAVKVLALMAHDPGVLATRGKKVEKPEDLKGLRIRVPSPFIAAMLEDLGAVPVGMPPGQVYENMQTGALDGVVLPWAGLSEFRITEVTTNAIEIGAYTTPFYFAMNQDSYDGLSAKGKSAVDKLSGDALVAQFPDWWKKWGATGADEITGNGGEVIRNSDELSRTWKAATAATVTKLEAKLAQECEGGAEAIAFARGYAAGMRE